MKKSKLMKKLAKKMGWKVVDLKLSKRKPIDLRGLPDVEREPVFFWFDEHDDNECDLIWEGMRIWNRRD